MNGPIGDGVTLNSPEAEAGRVSGVFKLTGNAPEKRGPAEAGDTVGLGKLDHARTGETLSAGKQPHSPVATVAAAPPVLALALAAGAEVLGRYLFFVSVVPKHMAAPYVPVESEAA